MALEHEVIKWVDNMIEANLSFRRVFDPDTPSLAEILGKPRPQIQSQVPQQIQPQTQAPQPQTQSTNSDEFESLKQALNSEKWPEAVNKNLICDPNAEKDKIERGRGIIELMIDEDLKGRKVLDLGCGEGHCAFLASDYEPTISVGYDIKEHPHWRNFEERPSVLLTTNFGVVNDNGPYDVIILFDVIDHVKNETPQQLLQKAKDLLAPKGRIYMRCHPLTSRHATHLYHDLNKAYVHLVFTKNELNQLVPNSNHFEENIGPVYPIQKYVELIEKAGLKEVSRRDVRENPEEFFKIPKIADRIKQITGHDEFPEFQMSLQFVDYVLSK